MGEGLVIRKRIRNVKRDRWTYFFCRNGDEKHELAVIDITFLKRATCIFNIENYSFRTKNYIKALGEKLYDYVKNEAIRKGHNFIICELVDSKNGLKFVQNKGLRIMTNEDYIKSGFDDRRDRHEGYDYVLEL